MSEEKIRIGKIVGCHGLRGDVKVRPASEKPGWAGKLKSILLSDSDQSAANGTSFDIEHVQVSGHLLLMRFRDFNSRTLAEALVGKYLYADFNKLPGPDEGEYWVDDLIGLNIIDNESRRHLGVVKDLLSSGGSDFLEIQLEGSRETVVVPFIDQFFPDVSVTEKYITVDLLSEFFSSPQEPVTPDRLEQ